ncbi:MAG: tRNA glutamyl-Q(34) synthetase GluQRS, partial [Planctomycetota bacterium]
MSKTIPDPARPVGRLAPSPTGRLHLGHARSFLLAWWHARSRGGSIVLRIEDLDATRVREGSVEATIEDLRWLGLDWDGEPLLQSRDTRAMEDACQSLLERGLAYPCICTRGEIEALSAPHAGEVEQRYAGTCRGRFASMEAARQATGRDPALRLRVPEGAIEIEDGVCGAREFDVAREVGDIVLRRRDGAFAYQLAVAVDDARQGVNEVVRGEDLLPSAARQWHVQELLHLPHPSWWHVPLVVDEQGERLAKRRDSITIASLRDEGV